MAHYVIGDFDIDIMDPNSVNDAISTITFLERGLMKAVNEFIDSLLNEGVRVAKANLVRLTAHDSEGGPLHNSIKRSDFIFNPETGIGVGYVTAGDGLPVDKYGNTYAVYVEQGTGSKKEEAKATKEKVMEVGKAKLKLPPGSKPKQEEQKTPSKKWVYYDEKLGRYITTSGQPPKPFMYDTYLAMWKAAQTKAGQYVIQNIPHSF